VIAATASPAPNASGWNTTDVTVSYACGDAGSGVNAAASDLASDLLTATGTATGRCVDNAGNAATASYTASIDKTAPATFTFAVSPTFIWPPDGSVVNVTVSGNVFDADSGAVRIAWSVLDEYGTYQPTGSATVSNGPYSFQLPLLRERRGNDKDGRHYTLRFSCGRQFEAAATAGRQRGAERQVRPGIWI
jgi:hypothetical protein